MTIAGYWFVFAIILLVAELIKTNGYALWLSVTAALTALITWFFPSFTLLYQAIVLILLGALLCRWWHKSLKNNPIQLNKDKAKETLGRVYTLKKPVKSGKGQLEIEGLIWFVYAEHDFEKGEKVRVKGRNGVVLFIEAYTD